ncbi:hypothetical protein ACUN24_10505 [Pedobacter sp. WC2501]|uniref:hypothetical protein n=1 Tax=Pedobacter sp. WC2501 TaxID=3461400 RepID=UPI0040454E61
MLNKLFQFFSPKGKKDAVTSEYSAEETSSPKFISGNDHFIEDLNGYTKSFTSHYLDEAANKHELKASKITVIKELGSTKLLKISGNGILFHNGHNIIKTESPFIIKYVQQEINPLDRTV